MSRSYGGAGPALLPPCFFAPALAFFTLALAVVPFVTGEVRAYFYQARILALTHALALGWISMAMLGVLYRYVPALTKCPLPYPRLAALQWATFVLGVLGLVTSFWLGRWVLTAAAAALLLASAALLCLNLWPLLLAAPQRGVAETGLALATLFLVAAATLGTVLAADKSYPLIGGSTITNIGAHAHLAALGWVGVTVCALSFRFLPAFLLPTVDTAVAARRQVLVLAVAVVLLATALLARSPLAAGAALTAALALVGYLVLLARVVASRRMPIDWTARHALAGAGWLLVAVVSGVMLVFTGVQSELGARLAVTYGVAGLLGWMSNLLIGVSYKLFPAFVAGARAARERPAAPVALLAAPGPLQAVVFVLYNAALVGTVGAVLADHDRLLVVATAVLAVGGALYGGAGFRTLAFLFVDPRPPTSPLRVLGGR